MMRAFRYFIAALTFLPFAALAEVRVDIVGVEGALRENVAGYVGDPPTNEKPAVLRDFADRAAQQADQALRSMGYYSGEISTDVRQVDDDWVVTLSIDPGQPIIVREVNVEIRGDAADDEAFDRLIPLLPIAEGQPLNHGDYESARNALRDLALNRGYFDFGFPVHRVAVNTAERWAKIRLVLDSGPRYRLGDVTFIEPEPFSPDLLARMVPFEPGTPYEASLVAQLNGHLLDSGYFADARVRVLRERAGPDHVIPVEVTTTAVEPNTIGLGVGYSTDVGPRALVNWDVHWLNAAGHSLHNEIRVSGVRQNVSTRYVIPLREPLTDQLAFFAGLQREDFEDTRSQRYVVGVERQQQFDSGWRRTQSLRYLDETFTVADRERRTALLMPGLAFSRTRTRGGLNPYSGDSQTIAVEVAHDSLVSDITMARVTAGTAWLRSFGAERRHSVLFRLDAGAIATAEFEQVPSSLRFFAGGDQSVRGYKYRSLAPENDEGDLLGGRYLITGTVEYSYEVVEDWSVAVFTDAGNAFNDFPPDIKVGSGFGVRWASPVGPIRLDFAWGVSEENVPFRIHLSLGASL